VESDITLFSGALSTKKAVLEIMRQNQFTAHNGLELTEQEAVELLETRSCSLQDTGRLELGAGAIGRLIREFSGSPYISQANYVETLHQLIEMFYYFKNETLDLMSDDDLVRFMQTCFDGRCGGSLELLRSRELEEMARRVRGGLRGSGDRPTREAFEPWHLSPSGTCAGADRRAVQYVERLDGTRHEDTSAPVEAAICPVHGCSRLGKTALSEEFYFRSLLTEAYRQGELDVLQVEAILMQCVSLVAETVERLNRGASSSVKVEAAQTLAESNFYTMGLYLKTQTGVSHALQVLKAEPVPEIYRMGRSVLESQLSFARGLYELVRMTKVSTRNYAYVATIDRGIEDFFLGYDPDFAAHEVPGSIDYQLLNPVTGLAGVEYMVRYLQSLYLENLFCSRFDPAAIDEVMRSYRPEYEDLLDNICGQVLQNALGCFILGKNVPSLRLSRQDVQGLKAVLTHKDRQATRSFLQRVLEMALDSLSLRSAPLRAYLTISLVELSSRIGTAMATDSLDKIFVPSPVP
jgi:hypothetical protein